MNINLQCQRLCLWLVLATYCCVSAFASNTFNWQAGRNRVTADIRDGSLPQILGQIAAATHWQVYVEPDTDQRVSAKFKDLPPGEALQMLLGDLNYALVPQTNGSPRLFVFRTAAANATQLIRPAKLDEAGKSKVISNELIVKLKPGAKIDDLARQLGAKVIGRIDGLNAYRLSFEDEKSATTAREQLSSNPDVTSVDSNYSVDRPPSPASLQGANGLPPPPQLQLKPPPDSGRIIVGLVDTGTQPLGNGLDSFMLKQLSVAGADQLDPSTPSHGTSMAETVLRSIQSMTKGSTSVQILPVDVYGPNESTTTFDVANGIVSAANGGAKIINLSLGSPDDSSFLHSVIQDVTKQNISIFAAAGNQPVTTPFYPAAYSEVTAVTAIDQGQLANYANRGSFVSLGAPGTSVVYYNNQPWYVVGTSSSSAFTSGIAAGYMESTHNNASQMQNFLLHTFGVKIGPAK